MLVEIVKDGNTVIRVYDDCYVSRSEEEIQVIIDEYCRGAIHSLRRHLVGTNEIIKEKL